MIKYLSYIYIFLIMAFQLGLELYSNHLYINLEGVDFIVADQY